VSSLFLRKFCELIPDYTASHPRSNTLQDFVTSSFQASYCMRQHSLLRLRSIFVVFMEIQLPLLPALNQPLNPARSELTLHIVTCLVTRNKVWIVNWIYGTLTNRNYVQLITAPSIIYTHSRNKSPTCSSKFCLLMVPNTVLCFRFSTVPVLASWRPSHI
jgi:hypothetical protein